MVRVSEEAGGVVHDVPAAGGNGAPISVRFPAPQDPDIGRHVPVLQLIPHNGVGLWDVIDDGVLVGAGPPDPGVIMGAGAGPPDPGVEEGLTPVIGEGEGVPTGDGPGAGEGHWYPKSGHVMPEKYTPKTVPKTTKQQQMSAIAIIIPVFILHYVKVFLKTLTA